MKKKRKFKIGFLGALALYLFSIYILLFLFDIKVVGTIVLALHFFCSIFFFLWAEYIKKDKESLWHSNATRDYVFFRYLYKHEKRYYYGNSDYIGTHDLASLEDFLGYFSYNAIKKYLERDLSAAIFCAAYDRQHGVVTESFASICLYRSHIVEHWDLYTGREVTLYCFVFPNNRLSVLPITDDYQAYENTYFPPPIYFSDDMHPTYGFKRFDINLHETMPEIFKEREGEFSYINDNGSNHYRFDDFSIRYEASDDEYQSLIEKTPINLNLARDLSDTGWEELFLPPFAKVTGKLYPSFFSSGIQIADCHLEPAAYPDYLTDLDIRIENILKSDRKKKRKENNHGN